MQCTSPGSSLWDFHFSSIQIPGMCTNILQTVSNTMMTDEEKKQVFSLYAHTHTHTHTHTSIHTHENKGRNSEASPLSTLFYSYFIYWGFSWTFFCTPRLVGSDDRLFWSCCWHSWLTLLVAGGSVGVLERFYWRYYFLKDRQKHQFISLLLWIYLKQFTLPGILCQQKICRSKWYKFNSVQCLYCHVSNVKMHMNWGMVIRTLMTSLCMHVNIK